MTAYYNENDKFAAAWLRLLIKERLIADGEVDERSIEEVQPEDLGGFAQCHFFAGIGIWSHALRCAGWEDDRPVWTGSCPCPSFSAAGQGKGFDDPRHLWPSWARLIRERKPATLFGEQADDAIGYGWLDLVQTDLERENYAVGKAVLGACSVGAPHIRQRLYFVAESLRESGERRARSVSRTEAQGGGERLADGHFPDRPTDGCEVVGVAHTTESRRAEAREHGSGSSLFPSRPVECGGTGGVADSDGRQSSDGDVQRSGEHGQQQEDGLAGVGLADATERRLPLRSGEEVYGEEARSSGERCSETGVALGDTKCEGFQERERHRGIQQAALGAPEGQTPECGGILNGFWRDAEWLYCRDGKYRPVEPGTFPMVDGYPNRVGTLRGYGNALCAPQAQAFIEAYMDLKGATP